MLEKQQQFARAYKETPVGASVLLDNILRDAGLIWEVKTEDVLFILMMKVVQSSYIAGAFDVLYLVGETRMVGEVRIELAMGDGDVLVKLSSTIPHILPFEPVWLVIGTGEVRDVEFSLQPPPELVLAGLLLMAAAIRAQRQMIIRQILLQTAMLATSMFMIVSVVFHFWIAAVFFIGFNLYLLVPRGWPRWVVIGITTAIIVTMALI